MSESVRSYPDYAPWLSELEVLADLNGIELHLDRYDYHTYFMRGFLPETVIEDIKSLAQKGNQ